MTDEVKQVEAPAAPEAPPPPAEEPAVEMVSIPDATDEDLARYLEAEASLDEEPPKEAAAPPPKEEKAPEPPPVQPQAQEQPQRKLTESEIKQRAVGLIRQVEGQERLIQNQISRLADFKKELKAKVESLSEGLDDKYLENPRQAFKDELTIKEAQSTMDLIDQETEKIQKRGQTVKVLSQHIKPEEWVEEDIAFSLQQDGIPADQVQAFVKDPLAHNADPAFLIQLQRRARAERALRTLAPAFDKLRQENEALKAQLANNSSTVLKNIEAAASTPPRLNGKAAPRTPRKPNIEDPSMLTDAELEEYLANSE